jgi:predicted enzyme related to lactoylglutathione lyase
MLEADAAKIGGAARREAQVACRRDTGGSPMPRVIHFEILAERPEQIAAFYEQAFGWSFNSWGGAAQSYFLASTGKEGERGIDGAIMGKHFPQAVINTLEVPSLEEALARIEKAGGKKMLGPNVIPNVGRHAYCADPAGGLFGVLEPMAPSKP